MRYRALDSNGDATIFSGFTQFLVNTPATVAQAVQTRLKLWTEEWFLDSSEGTPYTTQVLGAGTQTLYDLAIQERILNTEGVLDIANYVSNRNPTTRALTITVTIDTIYGQATLTTTLTAPTS